MGLEVDAPPDFEQRASPDPSCVSSAPVYKTRRKHLTFPIQSGPSIFFTILRWILTIYQFGNAKLWIRGEFWYSAHRHYFPYTSNPPKVRKNRNTLAYTLVLKIQ